jgi:hypothetical protein
LSLGTGRRIALEGSNSIWIRCRDPFCALPGRTDEMTLSIRLSPS